MPKSCLRWGDAGLAARAHARARRKERFLSWTMRALDLWPGFGVAIVSVVLELLEPEKAERGNEILARVVGMLTKMARPDERGGPGRDLSGPRQRWRPAPRVTVSAVPT